MADNQTGSGDDLADLAVWILAAVVIGSVWKAKVRPWLDSTWSSLSSDGGGLSVAGTSWDTTDLVGIGALVLVLGIVIHVLRKKRKSKKAARTRDERER